MSPRDEESRQAREDADWQALVEAYGDRPAFPEPAAPAPEPVVEPEQLVPAELRDVDDEDDPEDRFVPPPVPPVHAPRGLRGLAWFGIFGVPLLVLVCVALSLSLPSFLILLLVAWFVGGFGFLVATMKGPSDPDSGWDDGAVL